jgi:tetratricopeptide (TPR) repeat protein
MYDASLNTFKDGQKITATWHFGHNSLKICDPSQDIAKSVRVYVEGYTSKKFTMFLTVESNPNPRDDYKMKNPFFRAYHAIELFQKGYTYAEKKEYDSATAYYLKAIELDPDIGYEPYASLGHIYLEQDNYTEAIQNYEKTIELKPDYGEAYANLGIAHRQNGDLETGIIYYKKAARLGAKEIQSWLKENGYKW